MSQLSGHYYNECDPRAAAWLRELMGAGLIPQGVVDERSICDVQADDVRGFVQCHFFAGIGGWSLALQLAGWAPERPAWTGSCPCPPFSSAGKKKWCPECEGKPIPHPLKTGVFACILCGHEWFADGRHLYPEFHRLIRQCGPAVVFGEQVAGADGLVWITGVQATLEAVDYAFAAADLCAAGVKAPQIRQRLWWVAKSRRSSDGVRSGPFAGNGTKEGVGYKAWERERSRADAGGLRSSSGLEFANSDRRTQRHPTAPINGHGGAAGSDGGIGGVANYGGDGWQQGAHLLCGREPESSRGSEPGPWSEYDILDFDDGKKRRVESGTFPLAHGVPGRVGLLRGYGNAIVPQTAAAFIRAFEETRGGSGSY